MWNRLFLLVRVRVNRLWFGIPVPLFLVEEGLAILGDFFWVWEKPAHVVWRKFAGGPGKRQSLFRLPEQPAVQIRRVLQAGCGVIAGLRRQKRYRLLELKVNRCHIFMDLI